MAKIKLNLPFAEISGTMGDFVFRKGKNEGEAILAKRPKKSKKPSKAQKANRERFKLAAAYAKAALADPDMRALYEELAAKTGMGAFAAARSDYFSGKNLFSRK